MGAGKSTLGRELARLDAPAVRRHGRGDREALRPDRRALRARRAEFRQIEEQVVAEALAGPTAVIALGGGAVLSRGDARAAVPRRHSSPGRRVDVDDGLVAGRWIRPTARTGPTSEFGRLFDERKDDLRTRVGRRAARRGRRESRSCRPSASSFSRGGAGRRAAVIVDERVSALHDLETRALSHTRVPPERRDARRRSRWSSGLWSELAIGRDGVDRRASAAERRPMSPGFVARDVHLRGVRWVCRADDARRHGRRGDRRQDRRSTPTEGKNLAGAFHFPAAGARRPELPVHAPRRGAARGDGRGREDGPARRRALWELPDDEMIRACAAFKSAVVISGPASSARGAARILNLGHTFAHALEAGSGYDASARGRGRARACSRRCGFRAARPTSVRRCSLPKPVRVDRDARLGRAPP